MHILSFLHASAVLMYVPSESSLFKCHCPFEIAFETHFVCNRSNGNFHDQTCQKYRNCRCQRSVELSKRTDCLDTPGSSNGNEPSTSNPDNPDVNGPSSTSPNNQDPELLNRFETGDLKPIWKGWPETPRIESNTLLKPHPNEVQTYDVNPNFDDGTNTWHPNGGDPYKTQFWAAVSRLREFSGVQKTLDYFLESSGPWRNLVKCSTDPGLCLTARTTGLSSDEFNRFGRIRDTKQWYEDETLYAANLDAGQFTPIYDYRTRLVDVNSGETVEQFFQRLSNENSIQALSPSKTPDPIFGLVSEFGKDENLFQIKIKPSKPFWKFWVKDPEPIVIQQLYAGKGELWISPTIYNENDEFTLLFKNIFDQTMMHSADTSVSLDKFMKEVATVHYLMSHSAPFQRGSAAIAELFTAQFFLRRGLVFPGFKPLIQADVVALCTPSLTDYQNAFPDLLRNVPQPIN